ncbi:hypothetical protein AOQ84DRAFT_413018 [Glonium stellatum]|uniref:Uncharacterized protein n=1 Tax=Glonium stellatum TaxID=574774 RepID=A0A8E2JQA9_9PEZI|nr:hypothetical protein AOQ84DRAFT_413018 [Glonium stellatum]
MSGQVQANPRSSGSSMQERMGDVFISPIISQENRESLGNGEGRKARLDRCSVESKMHAAGYFETPLARMFLKSFTRVGGVSKAASRCPNGCFNGCSNRYPNRHPNRCANHCPNGGGGVVSETTNDDCNWEGERVLRYRDEPVTPVTPVLCSRAPPPPLSILLTICPNPEQQQHPSAAIASHRPLSHPSRSSYPSNSPTPTSTRSFRYCCCCYCCCCCYSYSPPAHTPAAAPAATLAPTPTAAAPSLSLSLPILPSISIVYLTRLACILVPLSLLGPGESR